MSALALSPNDAALVCVGFTDGVAQLFDRQRQRVVSHWDDREASVGAVAYHPHGRLVAGAWSSKVKLFDVRTKEVVRELRNPEKFVVSLAFDTNGRTLSLCSHDGTVRTYAQQANPSDNLAQMILEVAGTEVLARESRHPAAQREAQALVTSTVFYNLEFQEQMQLLDNLERRAQGVRRPGMVSIFAQRREKLQAEQERDA